MKKLFVVLGVVVSGWVASPDAAAFGRRCGGHGGHGGGGCGGGGCGQAAFAPAPAAFHGGGCATQYGSACGVSTYGAAFAPAPFQAYGWAQPQPFAQQAFFPQPQIVYACPIQQTGAIQPAPSATPTPGLGAGGPAPPVWPTPPQAPAAK